MKEKQRPIIAVLTAVACNTVQKELLNGISAMAMELGYDTAVLSNIYNIFSVDKNLISENNIYELVLSEQISAVIVDTEAFTNREVVDCVTAHLEKKDVPVVLVGEKTADFDDPRYYGLNTDDTADIELLTSHLIEVHGYKKVDMLTGFRDNAISERRAEGYRNVLRKHGITVDDSCIHYGDFWYGSGEELAKKYISGETEMPDAVVCANDCMAFGMLKVLNEADIRIPEDIAVVCYEFSEKRVFNSPLLTVCRRNWETLGRQAVRKIHSLLCDDKISDFSKPVGELVMGESCGCPIDLKMFRKQLNKAEEIRDHNARTLFSTMEQELTSAKNIDEFVAGMGKYQWQIRYVDDVFLCLYSDWYEKNVGQSLVMNCRSIMLWLDTTQFDAHKFDFYALFHRETSPAVYYFNPIFFREIYFGHLVLKYNRPDSYDQAFINWLKHVSNALEFLSMKNDIQYLMSCQDLSDSRDILTGMYNKKGLTQAYKTAVASGADDLFFVLFRVCIFSPMSFTTENEYRVKALLEAAKSVQVCCRERDIAGHIGDETFVCLVRSKNDVEMFCDALRAVLIRNKIYIESFGMDSFFCVGVKYNGEDFEALLEKCGRELDEFRRQEELRRSQPHYREMKKLRNAIYSSPEQTFEAFYYDFCSFSKSSIRMYYKKIFGISINQDCINARITMAKYYLAATALPMTDIAEKCGYIDYKYFLRQFNVNMGITAGQYRAGIA